MSTAGISKVELRIEDGIAVVTITNPPVNALGAEVRQGLMEALEKAKADPSVRGGVPDPQVEELIKKLSGELDMQRSSIPPEEIVERLVFPMVNEGARILGEGIASRASDIDVIWATGYGWPAWRGGPMYYAEQIGLSHVVSRLEGFKSSTGEESLEPSPVLRELASSGRKFTQAYP